MSIRVTSKPSVYKSYLTYLSQVFAIIAAFALPLSTAALEIFLSASVLCALLTGKWGQQYKILRTNPVALIFVIFFLLFLVGLSYTSAPPLAALHTVIKYSKFLLGFFLFSVFHDEKTVRYAIVAFLLAATLTLCLSFIKFFSAWDILHRFGSDSGIFKDHIFTGFLFAFTSYCYALYALTNKKWRWFFIFLFLLAVFNVLFINVGRSGYLVFVSLMLLLAWQQWRWRGLFSIAIGLLFFLVSISFFSSNFKQRIQLVQNEVYEYDKGKAENTSIGLRLGFYKNSLQLFRRHPWLGIGTGGYAQAYTHIAPHASLGVKNNPHNEYLNIAVQFGLLGIIVLLALFYVHWHESFKMASTRKNFAQAVLVSIAVGSLFNSWLMDVTQGSFYVLFTALAFASLSKLSPIYKF